MNEKTDRIQEAVTRLQKRLSDIISLLQQEKGHSGQFLDNQMQELLSSRKEKTAHLLQH